MIRRRPRSGTEPDGKAAADAMERAVYRNLGARRSEVLRGPGRGLDNAVFSLPGGKVMIVTSDPVSMIPALGARTSAWLSVHLIASDYTTSGTRPEFAAFVFNFPPAMDSAARDAYLAETGRACKEIGVSIVSGHTGSYPGADFTVIGAGTMFGVAERGGYVDPSMARQGDVIMMTKGAAIEAVASLSNAFPLYTRRKVGGSLAKKARALVATCSTVKDAMLGASVGLGEGGVSSMHDATEGGVLGGLEEMASASGKAFEVEAGAIPVSSEARRVCRAFRLDPLRTMGEGALLLTCDRGAVRRLEQAFSHAGVPVTRIGDVKTGNGLTLRLDGRRTRFSPGGDEYWGAYRRAERLGLS